MSNAVTDEMVEAYKAIPTEAMIERLREYSKYAMKGAPGISDTVLVSAQFLTGVADAIAALSAEQAQPVTNEGWQLVPKRLTAEMMEAACRGLDSTASMNAAYELALEAAPPAPAHPPVQEPVDPAAVDALKNHQRQLDADGVFVGVSREALDMVLGAIAPVQVPVVKALTLDVLRRYDRDISVGDVPDYPLALYSYLCMDGYVTPKQAISTIRSALESSAPVKGETEVNLAWTDNRPSSCRFRLQDEGKSYPRSSCEACRRTITTGLGRRCHVEGSAAPLPASPEQGREK